MGEEIERIAIVGMSGAFPGAPDIGSLWKMICGKREGISTLTREEALASGERTETLDDPAYVPRGGFLEGASRFDAAFFGVSPSDAAAMDPQQRLFLTHSRLALEDAGYAPERLSVPVGVFAGESPTQYWFMLRSGPYTRSLEDFRLLLGNDKDFIATRTSYKLNLKGPSLNVQTACSTSLAAVSLACQSLLTWSCDMALAGGVSVGAPRKRGYVAYEGMIVSPTGACRPFDERADGTLFGEGVGVVCLKRLSEATADGDYIYAVIDSAAMNNDGSDKIGFTAPSVDGQAEAIELAHALAGVRPRDIGYVEAHGTGTALGDPIEIQALAQAFGRDGEVRRSCYLGSIKANIGHLDAAAGIASLIKTALVLNTGVIPPMLHFSKPNPHLELEKTPFIVNDAVVGWTGSGGRRIAGVSSFGIGGTNVHAVLESPPPRRGAAGEAPYPLLLSARTPEALGAYVRRTREFLADNPEIEPRSLAAKIGRIRADHPWRKGFPTGDRETLIGELGAPADPLQEAGVGRIALAFPGQGSQFSGMARAYRGRLAVFTEWLERGMALARDLGCIDLERYLMEDGFEAEIARTETTQPLLYIVEYALAKELLAAGLKPDVLVGHSIGEYAAAAIGGAMGFEDGLRLVRARGYWMQRAPAGAMLALPLGEAEAARYLGEGVHVSVRNTATQTVLSGAIETIDDLELRLSAEGVKCVRLKTSHAFHSPLMESVLAPFADEVAKVAFSPLAIPMISNVDGKPMSGSVDWNRYWLRQLRQPVLFDACVAELAKGGNCRIVEAGPGRTLTAFIRSSVPEWEDAFPVLPNAKTTAAQFSKNLIRMWERGIDLDFRVPSADGRLVLFPGYPFGGAEFWADAPAEREPAAASDRRAEAPSDQRTALRRIWAELLGHGNFDDETSFFLCGADSFAGIRLLKHLKNGLGLELTMAELMKAPTIAGLAGRMDGENPRTEKPASRYLFPVQTAGDAPPLFMVAGAHENRYFDPVAQRSSYEEDFYRYFSRLIPALGENQPLYGFLPKGLAIGEQFHSSVRAMAEAYVGAMKTVQGEGPYFIGGECVGGIVAHEMACILEERGERVGRLVLMDTPHPSPWVALREDILRRRRELARNLKRLAYSLRTKGVLHTASRIRHWAPYALSDLVPVGRAARRYRKGLNGSRFFQRIILSHRPRNFNGDVTYIINREWNRYRFFMGWRRQIGRSVELVEVPGTHENRLSLSGPTIGRIVRDAGQRLRGSVRSPDR